MVDWDLAVRIGSRLAGEGPEIGRDEAAAVVAELRADAERSTGLVHDFTGLAATAHEAPILVVDRPGWVQANADGFRVAISPMVDKLASKKAPSGLSLAIGSRVTGAEVGGLLGFLAGKVLGQFDPFHAPDGRLLLVAPNIVHVERELGVDPSDFRLWVCLHEETHRTQFGAVPWLRGYLGGLLEQYLATVDVRFERGSAGGLPSLPDPARIVETFREGGLLALVQTREQRRLMDRVQAAMALVEGYSEHVMDAVGSRVLPAYAGLREAMERRRQSRSAPERVLQRLLGLDLKLRQYELGKRFCDAVVERSGIERLNRAWAAPEELPTLTELRRPNAWLARTDLAEAA